MDLIWRSDEEIFNYDTDMSPSATARAFAKEPWNSQFFDDLKKAHQTHYEQIGRIEGEITFFNDTTQNENKNLDGFAHKSQIIPLSMSSFRDHSYGKYTTVLYIQNKSLFTYFCFQICVE